MSHLVVGAGAVGIGIATALLEAGEEVVFAARGETARALRQQGCARHGLFGDVSFPPDAFSVVDDVTQVAQAPRSVLVATKTFASARVASSLTTCEGVAGGDAPIVLFQNGLGGAETFALRFPKERIWNARVITGFKRTAAQRVEITVHADAILLGSLFGEDAERLAPLAEAIRRGGFPTETTPEIGTWLWAKMLYNCALNPLGALLSVPYAELGRDASARRLMDHVVREIFAVLEALGEHTRWPDADTYLSHFYGALLPATGAHESSMLQDVRSGRPTEIDALCGEIARRGAAVGVETPVNQALAALIRALEAGPAA